MRKNLALVLLGVLLFNARARRLVARFLFELFRDPRLRRLILGQIARWLRRW